MRGGAQRKMRTPGRSPQSTPGGGAGENEPRHALLGSELDLLGRVRHESRNRRKATLTMGDGKTTGEGQRRVAQATAALNGQSKEKVTLGLSQGYVFFCTGRFSRFSVCIFLRAARIPSGGGAPGGWPESRSVGRGNAESVIFSQ